MRDCLFFYLLSFYSIGLLVVQLGFSQKIQINGNYLPNKNQVEKVKIQIRIQHEHGPWIHGGITTLGYDNAQENIIGEWVKNRIINIFKVLPYNEKCNVLKYNHLAT